MCNLYSIPINLEELAKLFGAIPSEEFSYTKWISPRKIAPILWLSNTELILSPASFGLRVNNERFKQYPLNNARVETLSSPPWREFLTRERCLIPLSTFQEPSYWGDEEGSVNNFAAKDNSPFLVAGLFNKGKNSKESSMSMITRPASDYMESMGHHREPFFLDKDRALSWLRKDHRSLQELFSTLKRIGTTPALEHHLAYRMKPSWKTRQTQRISKRDEEKDSPAYTEWRRD